MALISLFFCGGQSNAKTQWADEIEAALVASGRYDNVQVVWAYHPGERLSQWWTTSAQANYLSDFDNGSGGGALRDAIDTIEGAGNTWSLEGLFWFQGESDTGTTNDQAAYYTRFTGMIDQLETDFALPSPLKVGLAVIDANQDSYYDTPANLDNRTRADIEAVRTHQFNLGALANVKATDTRNYTRTDAWHLTVAELERLADVQVSAFLGEFPATHATLIEDADFHDEWECHDNAASTTVLSITGTHNGTLNGGDNTSAKRITGVSQSFPFALRMNGTDDYISLGTLPQGASSNPFTLLIYFRPNTVNGTLRSVFERGGVNGSLIYRSTGNTILYGSAAGNRWDFGFWTPTAGQWYKLAVIFDGTSPKLRVNGTTYTPLVTGTPVLDLTGGATTIGGPNWDADTDIADIGFFTRQLNAAEVDAWFTRPTVPYRPPVRPALEGVVQPTVGSVLGGPSWL